MTRVGLYFTSDIITFDQNLHHLYSSSAAGKDLSNDTQIRVIGSVEPEICTKIPRNCTEKVRAKVTATSYDYPMVKFAHLFDALPDFLNWKKALQKVNETVQQKDKKRSERKSAKKKIKKTKSIKT